MPKASNLINDKEREIAERVSIVRNTNQLSQTAFARALGISLDRLASIEYARTPLTVDAADKIAARFDVGLNWLANGEGTMKPSIGEISKICPAIKGSALFSKSYSTDVEKQLFEAYKFNFFSMAAILCDAGSLPKGKEAEKYLNQFHRYLDECFRRIPHTGREKLLTLMLKTLSKFDLDWELGRYDKSEHSIAKTEEISLTNVSEFDNNTSVKARLPELLKRLNEATSERGTKTALAKFMGVPLPKISQWLSGTHEPGGETTLMLLHWVEGQERQK